MRSHRWLVVLLLGLGIGLAGTAHAGPLSWLWPFSKPAPAKKHPKPKHPPGWKNRHPTR